MTTPRNTRGRRLKAAGWVRLKGVVPPQYADMANMLNEASEAHAAEAKIIEAIEGKPGRRPRGEAKVKRKTKPRKAERIATAPGKPGPKPKEAKG